MVLVKHSEKAETKFNLDERTSKKSSKQTKLVQIQSLIWVENNWIYIKLHDANVIVQLTL